MMHKIYALFAIFFTVNTISAQYFDTYFSPIELVPCPFNPTQAVQKPEGWYAYQTLNSLADGPIDSSRCISFSAAPPSGGVIMPMWQIDPARPLFFRSESNVFQPDVMPLQANSLNTLDAGIDLDDTNANWLVGVDCPENMCSGIFIDIAIPDSSGNAYAATRQHTGYAQDYWPPNEPTNVNTCFPAERFDAQYIRQITYKFTFDSTLNWSNRKLLIRYLHINQLDTFFVNKVAAIKAQPFHLINNEYTLNIDETNNAPWSSASNSLMLYTAPTYPSPQHLSYVEAAPEPNSAQQQTINVVVENFQTMEFQPFTQLRGALVAGDDSLRHHVNLINNGGEYCLNFIDLIVADDNEFRHAGGTMTMQNARSCMQLRRGGKLRVMNNSQLHYGNNGAGMLVMCPSGKVVIERGSTLVMDGQWLLSDCHESDSNHHVTVDLLPETSLIFTKNARLSNELSQYSDTRLRVRMLGGTLDDSALDVQSRSMIEKIYPTPSSYWADNLRLFPNPADGPLTLQYAAAETGALQLRWFSINGQLLKEETRTMQKGGNECRLDTPENTGLYFLQIQKDNERFVQKVAVIAE